MPDLNELARSLEPEERKRLLQKLETSLFGAEKDVEQPIYPKIFSDEQRELVILQKMRELSLFDRIILWFRNLFTASSKQEAFIQFYLSKKKKRINRQADNIFNLKTFSVKPQFVEYVLSLDISSRFLLSFYKTLWNDKAFFVEMVHDTLTSIVPSSKKGLFDFIPREDVFFCLMQGDSRDKIKRILKKKIEEYLDTIPVEVFRDIDHNLLPLFAAKSLVFFPYRAFYRLFDIDDPDGVSDFSSYRDVGFNSCENLLEKLYYAVNIFKRFEKYIVPDKIFEYYASYVESQKNKEDLQIYDVESLKASFKSLRDATIVFSKKVPLSDFFQVVHKDPFYRFYIYVPQINSKDFYSSSLILHVIEEYDNSVLDIVKDVIDSLLRELFPHGKEKMDNLNSFVLSRLKTLFPTSFLYFESFSIVFTVFKKWYLGELRNFFDAMFKAIPTRFKSVISTIDSINKSIDSFLSELFSYEQSFSIDSPDGRLLFMSEDKSNVSDVQRHLIEQKGKKAYDIVSDARNIVDEFKDFFEKLIAILPQISDIAEEYYSSDTTFPEYVHLWSNKIAKLKLLLELLKDAEHDLFFKKK